MTKAASITQADISRAIKAALDNGLSVFEVLVEPKRARVIIGRNAVAEPEETREGPQPKQWPKA